MQPDGLRLKPHPEPSADLSSRPLPIRTTARIWHRVYQLIYEPLFFDRSQSSRFNAPNGEFGVLYAGDTLACAFIETFGRGIGERVVTLPALTLRGVARIELVRPLRLVDLTGPGLARLGADARLAAGEDYTLTQRWSRAFWGHPDQPDGIRYRSRHDPARVCVALYDRAEAILTLMAGYPLADPSHARTVASILDRYGFGLLGGPR